MANRYDTNLILERIADSLDDDQNSALISSLDDIASAIGGGGGSGAGLVSDAFDDTRTYAVGDYCIHNNTLYKFTDNKTSGPWDSTKVSATTAGDELSTLNSKIIDIKVLKKDTSALQIASVSTTQVYHTVNDLTNYDVIAVTPANMGDSRYVLRGWEADYTNNRVYLNIANPSASAGNGAPSVYITLAKRVN